MEKNNEIGIKKKVLFLDGGCYCPTQKNKAGKCRVCGGIING